MKISQSHLLLAAASLLLLSCGSGTSPEPAPSRPSGMKYIPGGTFQMGQVGVAEPIHSITVSPFYMDSTELTQADYLALMGVNPSYFTGDLNRPVESVSWFDAALYCNKRSKQGGLDTAYRYDAKLVYAGTTTCSLLTNLQVDMTKNGYRLPTEAEWEYTCRAGTTTRCFWGDDSSAGGSYAWDYANSNSTTHPAATKLPNAWGLYDMAGNVWEWCNDWYDTYQSGAQTDPQGAANGSFRVLRGGSWYNDLSGVGDLRSACRGGSSPDGCGDGYGFRCVVR
jgi:formylglycine-generating enzyme required for sulfatase activity